MPCHCAEQARPQGQGSLWVLVPVPAALWPWWSLPPDNPVPCCLQILKRLYKALSLLKKEFELSKLQQRLGREVMGRGGEGCILALTMT